MAFDKGKFRKTWLALSRVENLRCEVPGWTLWALWASSCACPRGFLYFCSEVEAHFLGRLPSCVVSIELDLTREITEFHMVRFFWARNLNTSQSYTREFWPQEPIAGMQINALPPIRLVYLGLFSLKVLFKALMWFVLSFLAILSLFALDMS